ncbi:5383_t:CDS:1, partial [Racocetra fulgida]
MSKNSKYAVWLVNKGQINPNFHYGPYVQDWWLQNFKISNNSRLTLPFRLNMSVITQINSHEFTLFIVNKPSNLLQPGFLCSVKEKIIDIYDTPSEAINSLYWELFETQTEHLGLAVFGFYNEEIVSEILTDILFFPLYIKVNNKITVVVSRISYSSREELLYAGSGYTSSLVMCRGSETYLILQQVLENHCSLRVFKGKIEIHQYVGETPTAVWIKYGMHQNKDHFALFGLKDLN